MRRSIFVCLMLFAGACAGETGEVVRSDIRTQYHTLRVVRIAGDLKHPWAVTFLPGGGMLVTERPGRLLRIQDGEKTRISGVPEVNTIGQGGLLDVALHPDFEDNRLVYFTYAKGRDGGQTATALGRGRLEGDRLVGVEDVFVQNRYSSPGRHYGSRIAFTDDKKIMMSVGDRGAEPKRAQDLSDHAGSMLRLNDDGSVPEDNPFVGREGAAGEIYSYGHRNIQGLVIEEETGEIWVSEHGPRGGDEINVILPGRNYGWPNVTEGREYGTQEPFGQARQAEDVKGPTVSFQITIAPSGLAFVTGDRFARWKDNLLAGGLMSEQIRRIMLEGKTSVHQEELLEGAFGRVRDVRMGPDDYVYFLTDEPDGGLYRIEPM